MRNPIFASMSALMLVTALASTACSKPPTPAAQTPPPAAEPSTPTTDELGQPADPRFIGKIWVSTTPGHARGSILIFLPDRSLLIDSCFETYRISQWGAAGDRIRWIEDAIPIEATLSMVSDKELRLQVAGQDNTQSYVTATVPFVCPDMPK
jgi:hypothetical protein